MDNPPQAGITHRYPFQGILGHPNLLDDALAQARYPNPPRPTLGTPTHVKVSLSILPYPTVTALVQIPQPTSRYLNAPHCQKPPDITPIALMVRQHSLLFQPTPRYPDPLKGTSTQHDPPHLPQISPQCTHKRLNRTPRSPRLSKTNKRYVNQRVVDRVHTSNSEIPHGIPRYVADA